MNASGLLQGENLLKDPPETHQLVKLGYLLMVTLTAILLPWSSR
jgi:hypothetical protein